MGHRLRAALVVTEIALSLVLLAGAGLMIKSFWRLQQVNAGFDSQSLLVLEVTLPESKYPESRQRTNFFQQSLERISALPGVSGAAVGLLLGRFLVDILPGVPVIGDLVRRFPKMNVPPTIAGAGILIGMSLGLVAGLFPSVFAYRARVTELLRRT